jgi:rRNA maturation protein Nop10
MGASQQRKLLAGPPCEQCGGETRIVSIEPHRRLKRRHVWTLECMKCGAKITQEMPAPRRTH